MKPFWKSVNFWLAIVMLIGGAYVGFPEGDAGDAVQAIFQLFASGGIVYNFLKLNKPNFRQLLQNSNTYVYLGVIVTGFFPDIPGQAFTDIESIVRSILGGNWQGAIVAAFSLIGILFRLVRDGHMNTRVAGLMLVVLFMVTTLSEKLQFSCRLSHVYPAGPQVQPQGLHPIPAAYLSDGG